MGKIICFDVGRLPYEKALNLQEAAVRAIRERIVEEVFFFTEHDPVYTAGIHQKKSDDPEGIEVIRVRRGGKITFHGPGQIVLYILTDLSRRKLNIKELITLVQNSVIATLSGYGLPAEGRLHEETGVWTRGRKICSIGFQLNGSITMHGIALNVTTNMSYFEKIKPCGFPSSVMTSMMMELNGDVDINDVKKRLWENIKLNLGVKESVCITEQDSFLGLLSSEQSSETAL